MARRVTAGPTTWTVGRKWVRRPRWRVLIRRFQRRRSAEARDKSRWLDWLDVGGFDVGDDPAGCAIAGRLAGGAKPPFPLVSDGRR